ncbi:MAG: hypothetical protein FWC40_10015 [Proteobacteria bacterium]|nr:hypothetical protein [Pseudomonadota bacterium]
MFSDDDKRNDISKDANQDQNAPNDAQAEQVTSAQVESEQKIDEASSSQGKPLADVIPLHGAPEANPAVALEEVISNVKTAFRDLRAQLSPLRAKVDEVIGAVKETAAEAQTQARNNREQAGDEAGEAVVEEKKSGDAEGVQTSVKVDPAVGLAVETARDTAEVINLAVERLKRRGVEKQINIKDVVSKEFQSFADTKLNEGDYTVDEDGKRVITVDGKFVKEHAAEILPSLIGGVAQSLFGALFGDILATQAATMSDASKDAEAKAAEVADESGNDAVAEEAGNAADVHEEGTEADDEAKPKYRVQFDFAKLVGDIIKNAKLTPTQPQAAETVTDEEAKDAMIKGFQAVEDVLNGKEIAVDAVDIAPVDGPDAIEPIDEKHARILALSKRFEATMSAKHDASISETDGENKGDESGDEEE